MFIPAALFNFQNNLQYVALSYLDAATYQVLSQFKLLTTAVISILLLGTKLNVYKWTSLFLLIVGVSIIEVSAALRALFIL